MNLESNDLASLFQAALDAGDDRSELIERVCQRDPKIGQQLNDLLAAHEKATGFLSDFAVTHLTDQRSSDAPAISVANSPSVLSSIEKGFETKLSPVLLGKEASDLDDPVIRPNSVEMPKENSHTKYQLQGEIARGGMGAILLGRDIDLGRELAVKVLLDEHTDKPTIIHRFIEEAQIGGQLQHPGIVPVYELGQFQDSRPFFSMKLVKGKTLSQLLAERKSPGQERAKFLGIFEQVCQAMAYAHSRRVIHRDLKPSNIMVGAFGEVQVMDWGLAKVLSNGGVADEARAADQRKRASVVQTVRSKGSDTPHNFDSATVGSQTQMGSVMGTPAYMPPEQALGEIDRLDQRSDVFGLGAILCEILTSVPPYVATNQTDVFQMASRGKLDDCFDRLERGCPDGDLQQIVRKSLELNPEDRYGDAASFADQISGYLESVETRAYDAELAKVQADTRAVEEHKRRKVVMALAASVLLAMGLGSWGYLWAKQKETAMIAQQAERSRELDTQIRSELSTARALAQLDSPGQLPEQPSLERAVAAMERATQLIQNAPSAEESNIKQLLQLVKQTNSRLNDLEADFKLIAGLEDALEEEMQFREFEREKERRQKQSNPVMFRDGYRVGHSSEPENQESLQLPLLFDPIPKYQQAFSTWGLEQSMPPQKAADRLKALHADQFPFTLSALDRWSALLRESPSIERWMQEDWTKLNVVELTSNANDNFEVLQDGSILVSGDDYQSIYYMNFETDAEEISALRVEAMLHPSLPNFGPGRADSGVFELDFRISYGPLADSEDLSPVGIDRSISYHSSPTQPIEKHIWTNQGDGGRANVAVFTLDKPLRSKSGFRFSIRHLGKPFTRHSSLGRFRWSVCNGLKATQREKAAHLINTIADTADAEPLAKRLRTNVQRFDLSELTDLSEKTEFEPRFSSTITQLADFLMTLNKKESVNATLETLQWKTLPNPQAETENGTSIEVLKDGSLLTSGKNPANETIEIRSKVSTGTTAVTLQLIPHSSFEKVPWGRFGREYWTSIHELECITLSPEGLNKRIPLDFLVSDRNDSQFSDQFVDRLVDHDIDSVGNFQRTISPANLIFLIKEPQVPSVGKTSETEILFRIRTGGNKGFNLRRFRILTTTENPRLDQVQHLAESLLSKTLDFAPNNYWARISLAAALLNQTPPNHQLARSHAMAAIALRPNQSSGHESLLLTFPTKTLRVGQDNFREVVSTARRIHNMRGQENSAAIEAVRLKARQHALEFFAAGSLDEEISMMALLEELAFDNPSWWTQIGNHYSHREYPEEHDATQLAINAFQRVLEIEPNNRIAFRTYGLMLDRAGKPEEAIEMFQRAIGPWGSKSERVAKYRMFADMLSNAGRTDEAMSTIEHAIEIDDGDAELWMTKAGVHMDREEWAEAAVYIEKYLDLYSTSTGDVRPPQRKKWCIKDLGNVYQKLYDFESAEKAYRDTIALFDGSEGIGASEVYSKLAYVVGRQGRLEEAKRLTAIATERFPEAAIAHQNHGIVSFWMRDFETSERSYRLAIKFDPKTPALRSCLGGVLYELGNVEEAREWIELAVSMAPKNADHLASISSLITLQQNIPQQDALRSLELAERAIQLDPPSREKNLPTLAQAHLRAGDNSKAAELYKQSIEAGNSSLGKVYFYLAISLWKLGKKNQAIDAYKEGVEWTRENRPNDPAVARVQDEAESLIEQQDARIRKPSPVK